MLKRPCLVVGASGNIGEEIAVRLLKSGRTVALTHSPKSGPSDHVPLDDKNVRWYGIDVCDSADVTRLVKVIEKDFESVPDLVYCAGIVKDGSISLISDETWNAVIQTNLTGAFSFIRALSKSLMVAGDGRIIMIGSVSGTKGIGSAMFRRLHSRS